MTSCPVCSKPVDPIRARFVAVRDGKVVAYCSPECRDSQNSKPTAAPKSIADLDSGPVIEILHEPASGVVTSAKDERTTQPTGKFEKDEVVEETVKPRTDGSKTSGGAKAGRAQGADNVAVAGEVATPVIAPKRQRTRPSGKHLTRERKDSTEAKAGWDWLDDEPAEHARPGTVTESERRARWPFLVLLLLAAAAGGGYYVWKYVLNKPDAKASTPPVTSNSFEVAVDAGVEVDAAEVMTNETAVRRAKDVLLAHIEHGSPRVKRLAAGALGRTGDPAAVGALQQGIKQEKVAAARFKLAYELARAGDKSGREVLAAGLAVRERSDKLDAATRLAQLGDDRAKPLLSSLLTVAQHKLRAAEELSRLNDAAAIKLLEQVHADPKSSVDEKATATIALYRTGRVELAGEVKALLENESWRAFAAYALGEAKDEAARPILVEQITKGVGVKVRAAFALRRLGNADASPMAAVPMAAVPMAAVIEPLVRQLASQKDQEQIMAAEAILILAGDEGWAKHP